MIDEELSWQELIQMYLPATYQEEAKQACVKAVHELIEQIEECKTLHEVHQIIEVFKLEHG